MATDPVAAEATGQESITAEFGGREWRIPLDVDSWPTTQVLDCVAVTPERKVIVNHFSLVAVMRALLGDQWEAFTATRLKRRDLVAASNVFAEAVGIPAKPGHPLDVAFGAIPRLLFDLRQWPAAVEATLGGLGVDYRDRFRFQAGRRMLTLRQIHVRLAYAPYDCALSIARNDGQRPLSDAAIVLMDLWEQRAGQPHPARPLPPAEKAKRMTEAQKRAQQAEEYRRRHPDKRRTAADTARANAQAQ